MLLPERQGRRAQHQTSGKRTGVRALRFFALGAPSGGAIRPAAHREETAARCRSRPARVVGSSHGASCRSSVAAGWAQALVGGLLDRGWAKPDEIRIVEVSSDRRAELGERWPGCDVAATVGAAEGTVIAVKPLRRAVGGRRELSLAGGGRILSIAAGVTLDAIEAATGQGVAVIRAMPNTPASSAPAHRRSLAGSAATEPDLAWAEELLGAVGVVVRVSESQLDAVTGLSGSGPAYIFLVVEAMIDAGVECGPASRPRNDSGNPDAARCRHVACRGHLLSRRAAGGGDLPGRNHRGGGSRARAAGRSRRVHRCGARRWRPGRGTCVSGTLALRHGDAAERPSARPTGASASCIR